MGARGRWAAAAPAACCAPRTLFASMTSTIVHSLPSWGPYWIRHTRPTSAKRVKRPALGLGEGVAGEGQGAGRGREREHGGANCSALGARARAKTRQREDGAERKRAPRAALTYCCGKEWIGRLTVMFGAGAAGGLGFCRRKGSAAAEIHTRISRRTGAFLQPRRPLSSRSPPRRCSAPLAPRRRRAPRRRSRAAARQISYPPEPFSSPLPKR